jgi:hypothetical protein
MLGHAALMTGRTGAAPVHDSKKFWWAKKVGPPTIPASSSETHQEIGW